MMSGNLPKAERICREILESHPDAARAHLILGIVAQRTRRNEESVAHLTRALELNPASYDAAACLAAAYRILGEMIPAARFAEIAVNLKPSDAHARTELGSIYLEGLRLREAEQQLRVAADLSGGDPNVLFALSQCLEREGKSSEAARVARHGLNARPMDLDELLTYMATMIRQSTPTCAVEAALAALRLAPRFLRARALLARTLMEAGREAEARAVLEDPSLARSAEEEAGDSEAMALLGMAYQSFGRVEEARKYLRRAVEAPEPVATAYYAFTYSGRITPDEASIVEALEQRLSAPSPHDDLAAFHFALGKAYEDLGEYGKAMEQYEAGNGAHVQAGFDRTPGEPAGAPKHEMFTREFLDANREHGFESDLPVFVVGMIRSGTTLAEQILSSHPQIGGAGEVPYWIYNVSDLIDSDRRAVRLERLREAGERYVSVLNASAPGNARVVDKMPANFKSLGLLHLALPNARFIHMRRNPLDTLLSIYSTYSMALSESGNSKRDLVDVYCMYQETMAHWREVLPPDRLLEVEYESLVSDSEPTIRRMIEFCGLEWDEACLTPESNPRAVVTPSLWQVRRPIGKGSMGRWRRFEPWLGEFAELLPETP